MQLRGARAAARKTKTEREITACLAVAAAAVPLFSCHRPPPFVYTLASSPKLPRIYINVYKLNFPIDYRFFTAIE